MICEEVDPNDDAAFSEWFAPFHASQRYSWPDTPGWSELELRAIYRESTDSEFILAVTRDRTGRVTGCLDVSLPTEENVHLAYLGIAVDPDHRHQGIGQELLQHGEDAARSRGREAAIAHTERAPTSDARDERFAEQAGYVSSLQMAARELSLPVDAARFEFLELEAVAHSPAYHTVTWTGPCPVEYALDRVELARTMSADAPHSDAERDVANWTVQRLRDFEKVVDEMDRDLLVSGAVEITSGMLVGFTELSVPRTSPTFVYQFDTVVSPLHRGHRLGLLVKLANLRALATSSPGTERVVTNNAISNEPMIRVNEAMGFRLRSVRTDWLKALSGATRSG